MALPPAIGTGLALAGGESRVPISLQGRDVYREHVVALADSARPTLIPIFPLASTVAATKVGALFRAWLIREGILTTGPPPVSTTSTLAREHLGSVVENGPADFGTGGRWSESRQVTRCLLFVAHDRVESTRYPAL
jgi:hypothetical protein